MSEDLKKEIVEYLKSKRLVPHDLLGFVISKEDIKDYYEMVIKKSK